MNQEKGCQNKTYIVWQPLPFLKIGETASPSFFQPTVSSFGESPF